MRRLWTLIFLLAAPAAAAQTFGDASDEVFAGDVVATVRITIDPLDLARILAPENALSDVEYPARFAFESPALSATVDSVGFRLRGNTSRQAQKKSFRVSFNTFVPGGDFRGLEKLNLNGEHNDPSIMRSRLGWELFADAGVPASRASHVRLYINEAYFGLYMNVEHVDERFLRRRFGNDDGFLYKCLWPADLAYLGPTGDAYRPTGSDRRPYDLQLGRDDLEGYDDLAALIWTINRTSDSEFPARIERVFDVNGFLRLLAVTVATGSWDSYWFLKNNYYLYSDPADGRFRVIPYDFDNTFGIWWDGIWPGLDWASRNVYAWGHPVEARPLVRRLLAVPEFRERYTLYLKRVLAGGFDPERLKARALALRDLTAAAAEEDQYRTLDYGFTVDDYHDSYELALGWRNSRHAHVTHGLLPFIDARHASALAQLDAGNIAPVISDVAVSPAPARTVDPVTVLVRVEDEGTPTVEVEYWPNDPVGRIVPAVPAPDAGPDFWRAVVPPMGAPGTLDVRVRATDEDGATRLGVLTPVEVLAGRPALFLNELLALNTATLADPFGEFDDWVELYNAGPTAVSIGGMALTDDLAQPDRWVLPDLTVPALGHLLLWTDGQPEQGSLHGPFRLSGDGEVVALFDADGVLLDQVAFGAQQDDVAWARRADGLGPWVALTPTPGAPNAGATVIEAEVPEGASIEAWPNPFRDALSISAPAGSEVAVIDLLGRRVTSWTVTGGRRVEWDGRDLAGRAVPAGVYVVRVRAPGSSRTQALPVVRLR